jgi:hypothetical protein
MNELFDLWRKNTTLVEQRWPGVWSSIKVASQRKEAYFVRETPQPTLVMDGIQLSSRYDQISEARLQASLVPEGSCFAWIYGVGTGQLPLVLLQRQDIETLVIVIMNPDVVMQSFRYFDHTHWLSDPRVDLVLAENEQDIHFPFAAIPSCLQLASEPTARLRDLVFLELATPFIQARHRAQDEEMGRRLEKNLNFIHCDGDVSELFESRQGKTILVAAAGPTLASHYDWLLAQNEKHCLIAVDAALKPLAEAGIFPDIVVTIDPLREGIYPFFSGVPLEPFSDKALVYFPVVHGDVLKLWPGRRLGSYSTSTLYERVREQYPKETLFSSGSVLHPSVDLAVKMGAFRVILLGADLSFPGGNSHVAGSPAFCDKGKDQSLHWVLNGHGRRVPTTANLRGYLRDLERYITQCPGVQFVNGSKEGAHIQGTSYMEEMENGRLRGVADQGFESSSRCFQVGDGGTGKPESCRIY